MQYFTFLTILKEENKSSFFKKIAQNVTGNGASYHTMISDFLLPERHTCPQGSSDIASLDLLSSLDEQIKFENE